MTEEEPKYPIKPNIDIIIDDLYDVCEDEWNFKILGDQWWSIKASCKHGDFYQNSKGILYLTEAMTNLYINITEYHKGIEK